MALNAKKVDNGNRPKAEILDAGAYPARLVQVIDLGVQKQRPYKGEEKDPIQMVYTTYELADEFMKDEDGNDQEDKPRWVSEDFPFHNLEADRAKSTARYFALDPECDEDGDWETLLGNPVLINLTRTEGKGKNAGNFYNNVGGTSSMRKKEVDKLPPLKNSTKFFSTEEPDMEVFMALPKWLQDRIKEGVEFKGSKVEEAIKNYKKPEGDDSSDDSSNEDKSDDNTDDDGEEW